MKINRKEKGERTSPRKTTAGKIQTGGKTQWPEQDGERQEMKPNPNPNPNPTGGGSQQNIARHFNKSELPDAAMATTSSADASNFICCLLQAEDPLRRTPRTPAGDGSVTRLKS